MMLRFLRKLGLSLFLSAAGLIWSSSAQAIIVFENPYPDSILYTSSWCTSCGTAARVWDTFTLSDDTLINQIDARLLFSDTTSIEYSIWSADLSTQLFSQWFNVADLTRIALGAEQFETSAFLTGLNLNAGTYYLSIYDGGDPTSTLGWYNTVTVDGSGLQTIGADPFSDAIGGGNGKDFAFKIYDSTAVSVPEPSIIALLSLGLLGIVFARRKA